MAYQDSEVTICPMRSSDSSGHENFSFFIVPNCAKPKFLAHRATELGCDPVLHFKQLVNNKPVTLDDGSIIKPEMVQDATLPSHAFATIFLQNENHVNSFIENNQAIFDSFQGNDKFMPKMIYHSMPLECIKNKIYQHEFIARFDSSVIHILDCAETNREEYAK